MAETKGSPLAEAKGSLSAVWKVKKMVTWMGSAWAKRSGHRMEMMLAVRMDTELVFQMENCLVSM